MEDIRMSILNRELKQFIAKLRREAGQRCGLVGRSKDFREGESVARLDVANELSDIIKTGRCEKCGNRVAYSALNTRGWCVNCDIIGRF